jgi:hypothetical protein
LELAKFEALKEPEEFWWNAMDPVGVWVLGVIGSSLMSVLIWAGFIFWASGL